MRHRQRRQTPKKRVVCRTGKRLRTAVFLCWLCVWTVHGSVVDPFRTLGVSRTASPEEIKKEYRKLCLKYHPDKNVSKSEKERELCETKFKQVQEAFDMIENKKFGASSFRPQSSGFHPRAHGSSPEEDLFEAMNDMFQAFGRSGTNFQFRRSTYRPAGAFGTAGYSRHNSAYDENIYPANLPFKSVYVQSTKIPLEDLYKGISSFQFEFKDTLIKRYRASFRGKMIVYSICMGLMAALSVIRTSRDRFLLSFVGLMTIHATTPSPDPSESYSKPIQRGAKGGDTSIKFSKSTYLEIIFNIQEAKHPVYRREGNNLHSDLVITSKEADKGCKKTLEALDPSEDPIEIVIPPKKFDYMTRGEQRKHKTKNTVKIRGRGWPIPKDKDSETDEYDFGDLLVNIRVQKPPPKKRR